MTSLDLASSLYRYIHEDDRDGIYRRVDELTGQTLSHDSLDEIVEKIMHERNAYLQGWNP